jgi:hypothetical protein
MTDMGTLWGHRCRKVEKEKKKGVYLNEGRWVENVIFFRRSSLPALYNVFVVSQGLYCSSRQNRYLSGRKRTCSGDLHQSGVRSDTSPAWLSTRETRESRRLWLVQAPLLAAALVETATDAQFARCAGVPRRRE